MIKVDQIREFRPTYRYQNGDNINLQIIQDTIQETAQTYGIPVAFANDQVKSGGLFSSSIEDCLVLYHPEHASDYFKFAIRVNRQGVMAFVNVNDFGQSSQMNKAGRANAYQADRKGKKASYKIGSLIGQSISTLGRNKTKLEEEQMYYDALSSIFDEIIS